MKYTKCKNVKQMFYVFIGLDTKKNQIKKYYFVIISLLINFAMINRILAKNIL